MPPSFTPIALPPLLCTDSIDFILRHHVPPTTLIICSTRETFLSQLQATIDHITQSRHRPPDPANNEPSSSSTNDDNNNNDNDNDGNNDNNNYPTPHPLLVPTIHLIAKSSSVTLAFVPTVAHLRAYVATLYLPTPSPALADARPKGSQYPMLAVWGMADLHRSTAEHSAQGLSRSLAVVVEAASRNGQRLVLAEARALDDEEGEGEGDPWREQVPLMSGSVRFGGEDRVWAGKTVEVARVVRRWCRFVRVDDAV